MMGDTGGRVGLVEDVDALVRMHRWVSGRGFPSPGRLRALTAGWMVVAGDDVEFDRLVEVMAADGIVEHTEGELARVARRWFGDLALEVYQPASSRAGDVYLDSVGGVDLSDPVVVEERLAVEAEAFAEDDALEVTRGVRDVG